MNEILDFLMRHWEMTCLFVVLLVAYVIFEIKQDPGSKEVSVEKAVALYNHEHALILDIRSQEAYAQGHIVGAVNLTADQIDAKIKKLQKYAQKPVIVVCNVGRSSLKVVKTLQSQGISSALSLSGGIAAWQAAGLPLTTASCKYEL